MRKNGDQMTIEDKIYHRLARIEEVYNRLSALASKKETSTAFRQDCLALAERIVRDAEMEDYWSQPQNFAASAAVTKSLGMTLAE